MYSSQILPIKGIRGDLLKVVMINDCAFVGETLLKYLPENMEKHHIKRTRSLLSKTFGVAYKILKVKGDIFHVHYLLQDCYLAEKIGKKPLIGHAHGSDLREAFQSKKWRWMIKKNLKNCRKILVAQPTILETAKTFNKSAEYFPIPYDPEVFYPKPLTQDRLEKRIFLASAHDFRIKGTDKFLRALAGLRIPTEITTIRHGRDLEKAMKLAKELKLKVKFIHKTPHHEMNKLYWESDLVLGSFAIGQLDTVAIEGMACGRPVVHIVKTDFYPSCPLEKVESIEECTTHIYKLLIDEKQASKLIRRQFEYVKSNHDATILATRLTSIYNQLLRATNN